MPQVIEQYALAIHANNGARVRIKRQGHDWGDWKAVGYDEFVAFAALMRDRPVFLGSNGWLRTGPEPVGEGE